MDKYDAQVWTYNTYRLIRRLCDKDYTFRHWKGECVNTPG